MGRGALQGVLALDRRTLRSWITLLVLAAGVAVFAACTGQVEDTSSSQAALAVPGRWKLPAEILAEGAKVRITYENAPKWTGTAACGGGLRPGGRALGKYLLATFTQVTSVGGYSCRKNTADSSRMSVHGTGRALDVFIPQIGGDADNSRGDEVANWFVTHATRIGVDLVIWDHAIWRANGTNASPYGGPVPHTDHIHVEITTLAAALGTPWFSDMSDDTDDGASADGGATDDDDASTTAADAATEDAGDEDAGFETPDAATEPDAAIGDPSDDDHSGDGELELDAGPDADVGPTADSDDGLSSADDEPGETDSFEDEPRSKNRSSATSGTEADPTANRGCSTAPGHTGEAGTFALLIGLAALVRRKRSRRDARSATLG